MKTIFTYLLLFCSFSLIFTSCKKEEEYTPLYLKINLKDPFYNSLNEIGGIIYIENVLIARLNDTEFAAVNQGCSADCIVEYDNKTNLFSCPCIGKFYTTDAAATDGSASLRRYNTTFNDQILHVFE